MDDLIKRLQDGVVEHDKRWSGDTHDDLGGSANYEATEAIMTEAAAALAEAQATIARLEAALIKWRTAITSAAFKGPEAAVEDRSAVADAETELLELAALAQGKAEGTE